VTGRVLPALLHLLQRCGHQGAKPQFQLVKTMAARLLCAALLVGCLAGPVCGLDLGAIFGGGKEEEAEAIDQSRSPMVVKTTVAMYAAAAGGARAALQLPLGAAANVSVYRRSDISIVLVFQVCTRIHSPAANHTHCVYGAQYLPSCSQTSACHLPALPCPSPAARRPGSPQKPRQHASGLPEPVCLHS
jgi:hypothetical protein